MAVQLAQVVYLYAGVLVAFVYKAVQVPPWLAIGAMQNAVPLKECFQFLKHGLNDFCREQYYLPAGGEIARI